MRKVVDVLALPGQEVKYKILGVGHHSYYWWKRSSTSNKALRKE